MPLIHTIPGQFPPLCTVVREGPRGKEGDQVTVTLWLVLFEPAAPITVRVTA